MHCIFILLRRWMECWFVLYIFFLFGCALRGIQTSLLFRKFNVFKSLSKKRAENACDIWIVENESLLPIFFINGFSHIKKSEGYYYSQRIICVRFENITSTSNVCISFSHCSTYFLINIAFLAPKTACKNSRSCNLLKFINHVYYECVERTIESFENKKCPENIRQLVLTDLC